MNRPNIKSLAAPLRLALATLLAMTAWSCSSEIEPQEPDARPMRLSIGTAADFAKQPGSRAVSADPQSITAIYPETCGLYGEMENLTNSIFSNQIVYRRDGAEFQKLDASSPVKEALADWPADNNWIYAPLRYWTGTRWFQFYCYAPHSSVEGTMVNLTNNSYDAMNTFQMRHIPPYSPYDYTVAKRHVKQNNGDQYVPFDMQHVSARICLRLKIGREYSKMRRILIKEVTVNDRPVGNYYQYVMTFNNDDQSLNSLIVSTDGDYNSEDAKIFIIPIFNDPDGLPLSPDVYKQFGSLYVMPQTMTTLTINVVYDVYDLVNSTPVRADQRVTNTVSLKGADGKFIDVESGKYYEINILVSPEYLYVLSDNDIEPHMLISPTD